MNADTLASNDQQLNVRDGARYARRQRPLRRGQGAPQAALSMGTLQALMGLAAYQARRGWCQPAPTAV